MTERKKMKKRTGKRNFSKKRIIKNRGEAKSKIKNTLKNYTSQLISLGALQQTITRNLQTEIENI